MREPLSILISGASSGIGEALALAYAGAGITLFLCGRDRGRIESVAAACRRKGADAEPAVVDVIDREACARWVEDCDHRRPLDLLIANAGITSGSGGKGESAEQARRIFAVNVNGVVNTVLPALHRMQARRRGQIAIMSSIAGFRGIPGSSAYCASKAAGRIWGEGLREALRRDGIEVSVVCPGFVRSRITAANDYPMPFLMEAAKAAVIIRRGLAHNKARIAFPWPMAFGAWLAATLPPALIAPLMRRISRIE